MLKFGADMYTPYFRVVCGTTPKGGSDANRSGMERVCDRSVLNWRLDRSFDRQATEPFGWRDPGHLLGRERKPILEVNWPAVLIYLGFVPFAWVAIIYFVMRVWP